jgi:hypothetical protein
LGLMKRSFGSFTTYPFFDLETFFAPTRRIQMNRILI